MDIYEAIDKIEDNSVRCCITSPPYYKCRDYGHKKQIGLEDTPLKYAEKLGHVFELLKPKLKEDGNLFVNIGDKYENKSLMLLPAIFAETLKLNGWFLRNSIIWHKPNFQPSPVKDRLANAYEYVFHFTKIDKDYYYDLDAIRTPNKCDPTKDESAYIRFVDKIKKSELTDEQKGKAFAELGKLKQEGKINNDARLKLANGTKKLFGSSLDMSGRAKELQSKGFFFHTNNPKGKNPGDVLHINIKSYKGIHEAVFPEELVKPLILVGSEKDDLILDPFAGSGTTCRVAEQLGRKGLGVELNEEYVEM